MATLGGGATHPCFQRSFNELEDKIRQIAESMAQLRQEKSQLEQNNRQAEQRIAELEGELKRQARRAPADCVPTETPMQHLNTRPADAQEQALHRLTETRQRTS